MYAFNVLEFVDVLAFEGRESLDIDNSGALLDSMHLDLDLLE